VERVKSSLASLFVVIAALTASAGTFFVTNTNDSGPGSLRQAILDAHADRSTPLPQLITFNIPGSGVHTITVQSALPALNYVITIDGYTQPGAKPNSLALGTDAVLLIEINGGNLPAGQTGIRLGFSPGDGQEIRGLVINGFTTNIGITDIGSHRIFGCYLGTNAAGSAIVLPSAGNSTAVSMVGDTDNSGSATIGGPAPADRNVVGFDINFTSNRLPPSGSGVVRGNYIGISADGRSFINPNAMVSVAHLPVQIGGSADGAGNVIGGGVVLFGTNGVLLQRNLIGTDATGMVASPGAGGLDLITASLFRVMVGTRNTAVLQNVIVRSDTSRPEVVSVWRSTDNTFQQNFIGLAADGKTPLGNRPQGIALEMTAANNTIGGINPGDGNVIAFAAPTPGSTNQPTAAGVTDGGATAGYARNFIERNSITGSGGLGIDLAAAGVTPNDVGDADGIQNYPALTSAVFANGTVRVTGSLNSTANASFRIEHFGNDNADPSGYGQGQYYLGFTSVTTDASGNASFDVTLPVGASVTAISSTATGPTGTSEFSATLFAKLLNISTRADVQTGDDLVIGGFIITGTDAKKLLLRGIGPSLNAGGAPVPGRLQNPIIALYDSSGTLIAQNNDWESSDRAEIEATGIAPNDRLESALLMELPPEAYTVHLRGVNGGTGLGLIEVYDLGQPGSRLANISTRSRVGTGNRVMIGGFIIGPNNGGSGKVLVRGLGPSLASVSNPLQDPTLQLRDGNGLLLASNDDWKANEAQVTATGLAPPDDRESALTADLAPGNYTTILQGKDSTPSVGVVEIYHL
jgi:hypothetical protein